MYDDILGPILVAYGSGVFLFGVLTLQTLFYYRKFSLKGPAYLRIIVLLVWLLELAHTSVSFVIVYKCMISYSGGLHGFEQSQPFFSANGVLAVLIAAVVQSYSALRLYQLQTEKSFVVPALCWVASLLRIFIYVGAVAHEVNPRSFAHTTRFWRIFLMFVGILALLSDLLMGLGLSKELYARRHNLALRESQALALEADLSTRRRSTSLVIDRFILLCISTNLMTCLSTLAAVVLFYTSKGMYWMPVAYISCRCLRTPNA